MYRKYHEIGNKLHKMEYENKVGTTKYISTMKRQHYVVSLSKLNFKGNEINLIIIFELLNQ